MPALIAQEQAKLAPANDDALTNALTLTCGLLGFQGGEAAKTEWIAAAMVRLQDLPGDLVFEALREAEKTCRNMREVVPAVFAYAADYPSRRRARLSKLLLLADAIG